MSTFQELKLSAPLHEALTALQFVTPTPIQAQAIPFALEGRDVLGCAQTGTGKTAAFCIPLFEKLAQNPNSVGLVLTPTRELAMQIHAFWQQLTAKAKPSLPAVLLVGGNSMQPQIRALRQRPRLLIGTPGRVIDHLGSRTLKLDRVCFLVLDEADRMLDMGFAPQLNEIRRHLPNTDQVKRQTLFFTATWEERLNALASRYLVNPERVTIGQVSKPTSLVQQTMIEVSNGAKKEALLDQINQHVNHQTGSVLVFARTQHRADRVAFYLAEYGVKVSRIHGGRSQAQRNAALADFRSGKVRVLVATDIASRGIDVASVGHVINFDLPQTRDDYVHRIGRTGRAGQSGEAISFVTPEDRSHWRMISGGKSHTGKTVAYKGAANLPARVAQPASTSSAISSVNSASDSYGNPRESRRDSERRSRPPRNGNRFEKRDFSRGRNFGPPRGERSFEKRESSTGESLHVDRKPRFGSGPRDRHERRGASADQGRGPSAGRTGREGRGFGGPTRRQDGEFRRWSKPRRASNGGPTPNRRFQAAN